MMSNKKDHTFGLSLWNKWHRQTGAGEAASLMMPSYLTQAIKLRAAACGLIIAISLALLIGHGKPENSTRIRSVWDHSVIYGITAAVDEFQAER
jgi:hypothetical protein